jgi:hypothetical protein
MAFRTVSATGPRSPMTTKSLAASCSTVRGSNGPITVNEENTSGYLAASPVQSRGNRPAKWAWSMPRWRRSCRRRSSMLSVVSEVICLPGQPPLPSTNRRLRPQ